MFALGCAVLRTEHRARGRARLWDPQPRDQMHADHQQRDLFETELGATRHLWFHVCTHMSMIVVVVVGGVT